jgi:gluconate 2-dehydrogenase gamma chain
MADRRDALKIIGAIGTTCAFPYSADELYGQHDHGTSETAAPIITKPVFFSDAEFETVKVLADLIIPAGDTPGALAAGVPGYIDLVVNAQVSWKKLFRDGLEWLDARSSADHGRLFRQLNEEQQVAIVEPLCRAADAIRPPLAPAAGNSRRRATARRNDVPMEVQFFKAFKSMTADGYFTSKAGLVDTLGYQGNTVLGEFPTCIHEH